MIIKSFQDLIVWQKAHQLTLEIYTATRNFPKEEIFVLTSQIRRAVISVECNIAEGFSRKSIKEKRQFYYVAKSSLEETKCQSLIMKDLKYIKLDEFNKIINLAEEVSRLLNYWINK